MTLSDVCQHSSFGLPVVLLGCGLFPLCFFDVCGSRDGTARVWFWKSPKAPSLGCVLRKLFFSATVAFARFGLWWNLRASETPSLGCVSICSPAAHICFVASVLLGCGITKHQVFLSKLLASASVLTRRNPLVAF